MMLVGISFPAQAKQTEIDLNISTENQFFQFRNGVWAWDWHFEAYQTISKRYGGFSYGLIYQGREGDDLEWHQIIWSVPWQWKPTDSLTIKHQFKLNYIPGRSVGPEGYGLHYRWNMVQQLNDKNSLQLFLEPRWQGDEYFGHKSRVTWNRKVNTDWTAHVGYTWYGNANNKWLTEDQYVFMMTRRF